MNIGEYKVTTERSENSLYRWVEAVNTQKEKTVIIQILQPGISPEITANLISYFDTLQAIRRKNLWLPEQVFSNADYPLVLIYPYLSTTPLTEVLQQSTQEEAIEWWHQASETLHTLHNKNIVHGCIALDSFVVVERSVCLTGFGYAPFLQMGEPKAIQECREVVAPEVLADHYLTSAADIYGFAKTVANWQTQLLTTTWYNKATNPKPEFRYPRIRDCFQYLQETLLRCVPEEYNQAQRTKTSEDAVETESKHQQYILKVKVKAEPTEVEEEATSKTQSLLKNQEYESKLRQYEQEFLTAVQSEYPLSVEISKKLTNIQQSLKLNAFDVQQIEKPIRLEKEAEYWKQSVAKQQENFQEELKTQRKQQEVIEQKAGKIKSGLIAITLLSALITTGIGVFSYHQNQEIVQDRMQITQRKNEVNELEGKVKRLETAIEKTFEGQYGQVGIGRQFVLNNRCYKPIKIAIKYKQPSGEWKTGGWWNIDSYKNTYLAGSEGNIRLISPLFYYYAEFQEGGFNNWGGEESVYFNGRNLSMRTTIAFPDANGDYTLSLICTN